MLAVAPFGEPPLQEEWTNFQNETGIPVVIDAAASFEAVQADTSTIGDVPVTLSFHATKTFSTGEGGAVLWRNRDGLIRTVQAMNFGMVYTRESRSAGFNGKLSEYHAAVGLAGLDRLNTAQQALRHVVACYRKTAEAFGLAEALILPPAIASCYVLFRAVSQPDAETAVHSLNKNGIETRYWYGKKGTQAEVYFKTLAGASLPETEKTASRIIGIPTAEDMDETDIRRVMEALHKRYENV